MIGLKKLLILFIALLLSIFSVKSEEVHVAVSANFLKPIKQISKAFEQQYSHTIVLHTGSTGQLYAQALYGAPFDLFLAADTERVKLLIEKGLTQKSSTYSCGLLAFYSEKYQINSIADLDKLSLIALANPDLAPYGQAAEAALKHSKTSTTLKKVYGQNIASAYQYALNNTVDGSFVAYSYVIEQPAEKVWLLPTDMYQPIKQDMALLKRSHNPAAKQFYEFILSQQVQSSIARMGYTSITNC